MGTMNISLPDSLKEFVDEQVSQRGYGTSSEYVRELIRKEQDRMHLRGLLLQGAASKPTRAVNASYFDGLRRNLRFHTILKQAASVSPRHSSMPSKKHS